MPHIRISLPYARGIMDCKQNQTEITLLSHFTEKRTTRKKTTADISGGYHNDVRKQLDSGMGMMNDFLCIALSFLRTLPRFFPVQNRTTISIFILLFAHRESHSCHSCQNKWLQNLAQRPLIWLGLGRLGGGCGVQNISRLSFVKVKDCFWKHN